VFKLSAPDTMSSTVMKRSVTSYSFVRERERERETERETERERELLGVCIELCVVNQ